MTALTLWERISMTTEREEENVFDHIDGVKD